MEIFYQWRKFRGMQAQRHHCYRQFQSLQFERKSPVCSTSCRRHFIDIKINVVFYLRQGQPFAGCFPLNRYSKYFESKIRVCLKNVIFSNPIQFTNLFSHTKNTYPLTHARSWVFLISDTIHFLCPSLSHKEGRCVCVYSSNLHSSSGHTFYNNILVQYKLICITKAGMLGYIKGPNEDVHLRLIRKSED